jgi:hypothetical protein
VIDLSVVADKADWPVAGRSLIIDSTYKGALLKDSAIKKALDFGSNAPIRDAEVQRLLGFDLYGNTRIPANGENLVGMMCFPSAILFASAAVAPTPDVRAALSLYEVIVEPETGAAVEHRRWGNADTDSTRETIEISYGRVAGEANALKRLVSA